MMESALLAPVIKGFTFTLGGMALLGGGGYVVHKKLNYIPELSIVLDNCASADPNKKFFSSLLVSRPNLTDSVLTYEYKIPSGYSLKDVQEYVPAIEAKLNCSCDVWVQDSKFVFTICKNQIPNKLVYSREEVKEILKKYECGFYLGQSRFGPLVFDMTENSTPHLMFASSTGGGKSNLLNQGMCGMIDTYTPEQVNFYLTDLKDGVELRDYVNIPHVKAFWDSVENVNTGLEEIINEITRRNELFRQHKGVKKLSEYNEVAKPLPRLILIADEFAQFGNISDKELKKSIITQWAEILQKGRSAGIHVIAGTQVADADSFPKQIGGNMDARIGFKVARRHHSEMLMDSTCLYHLPNIPGRAMFKIGMKLTEVQVPLLEKKKYEEIINEYSVEIKEEKQVLPLYIPLPPFTPGETESEEKEDVCKTDKVTMDIVETKTDEKPVRKDKIIYEIDDLEDLFIREEDLKQKSPA